MVFGWVQGLGSKSGSQGLLHTLDPMFGLGPMVSMVGSKGWVQRLILRVGAEGWVPRLGPMVGS